MTEALEIVIVERRCSGHGRCYTLAPELISDDPAGFPEPIGVPIRVPVGKEALARELEDNCPERALVVRKAHNPAVSG